MLKLNLKFLFRTSEKSLCLYGLMGDLSSPMGIAGKNEVYANAHTILAEHHESADKGRLDGSVELTFFPASQAQDIVEVQEAVLLEWHEEADHRYWNYDVRHSSWKERDGH